MAEVDVSSYKAPAEPSILDIAGKLNTLDQQSISLEKSKLDLINQKYGIMKKEIFSLANEPNVTPEMLVQKGQSLVKAGVLKPEDYAKFVQNIPPDPAKIQPYLKQVGSTLLDTQAAINFQYGSPGTVQTGGAQIPVVTSPAFGMRQTGAPIQNQMGPGQLNAPVNVPNAETGATDVIPQEEFINRTGGNVNQPAQVAPIAPQAGVQGSRLPVAAPAQPQQRRAIQGQSPELEGSIKALNEDRAASTGKMQSVKPMIQALGIIGDIKTGIGTEPYNKARAALINAGLIDANSNDPTVIYQEVNKKLSNYIQNSANASRSDKAQALAQESNPDVKGQLNPALVKLARDNIALDRVEAARSIAFKGKPVEYSKFRSEFPQSVDEKAFAIDLLPPDERNKLIEKHSEVKDGKRVSKTDAASEKFWKSLAIAKSTGVLNPVQ